MSQPFMQLYVADYLGDTRHLTTEQHGAYLLLLMTMWRAEGRLPNCNKKLARIVGATASRWAKIKAEVLEFFEVDGESITNKRLMFELKKASEKSIKRAEAGTRGGAAKALKDNKEAVANASGLPCHSSEPEPDTTVTNVPVVDMRDEPKKPRATKRCPNDFRPTEADIRVGLEAGLTEEDVTAELAAFLDYTFSTARSDWSATFRNWLRKAAQRKPTNRNQHGQQPSTSRRDAKLAGFERAVAAAGVTDLPDGRWS